MLLRGSFCPTNVLSYFCTFGGCNRFLSREGTTTTPPHKFENFKFYTYAPRAYRHFREIFNIDTAVRIISDFFMKLVYFILFDFVLIWVKEGLGRG